MPYLHLIAVVLIMMLYICEVCLCNDSLGNYYEMKVDSAPTGTPYSSFSSRTRMKCATVCNSDVECSTFTSKEIDNGVECELYKCWGAKQTITKNNVTTFTKEGYDSCPSNYECGLNDHCYHNPARRMTWDDARDYCNSTHPGAYLAEVNSSEENDFIFNMTDGYVSWLGGRRLSGTWTWTHSGLNMSDGYQNWYSGQPVGSWDCMVMDTSGLWYAYPCQYPGPMVCEYGN